VSVLPRRTRQRWRAAGALAATALAGTLLPLRAQTPGPDTEAHTRAFAERVEARMVALETEADTLAGQVRALLDELRTLEQDQVREAARVTEADDAVAAAQTNLETATARLADLEARRLAQAPDIAARLVEIYKQGRGGDVRLLLGVSELREFGRAARTLAALAEITEQRLEAHRQTLAAVRGERAGLQTRARELEIARDDARRARDTTARAAAARDALIIEIDGRRDLNAELTGALRLAAARLDQQLVDLAAGRPVEPFDVPIGPFRGALAWPASGAVQVGFGEPAPRLGGIAASGLDIAATPGAPVRAVHPGEVQYAAAFAGFGTLVIVDHGSGALSLYGYLASTAVAVGDRVEAGAPVGAAGEAPGGAPGLYFELRIDGRSVDPVEWLQAR
jgi:septal ring factor EnvC (AmiA/AmiB activator)